MPVWNVAAAQYGVRPGDLRANIAHHLDFIRHAAAERIDLLIFPERSLTGYDPGQVDSHALPFTDALLNPLEQAAVEHQMTLIVGMTLSGENGPSPGSVGFLPDGTRVACPRPPSTNSAILQDHYTPLVGHNNRCIAMGLSVASDEETWPRCAATQGADLYATSKYVDEISFQYDEMHLQRWAHKYNIPVLFANHAFSCGPYRTAGRSACWDSRGVLVVRADQGELLAIGRRDEKGWHGEVIPLR